MQGELKTMVYNMKFIVNKKVMAERVREHRPIYHRLNQIILGVFEEMASLPEPRDQGNRNATDDNSSSEVVRPLPHLEPAGDRALPQHQPLPMQLTQTVPQLQST